MIPIPILEVVSTSHTNLSVDSFTFDNSTPFPSRHIQIWLHSVTDETQQEFHFILFALLVMNFWVATAQKSFFVEKRFNYTYVNKLNKFDLNLLIFDTRLDHFFPCKIQDIMVPLVYTRWLMWFQYANSSSLSHISQTFIRDIQECRERRQLRDIVKRHKMKSNQSTSGAAKISFFYFLSLLSHPSNQTNQQHYDFVEKKSSWKSEMT